MQRRAEPGRKWFILGMTIMLGALAAVFVMAGCRPAAAQVMPCAPYPAVAAGLLAKHGEVPAATALSSKGDVLRVLASPVTGSYTVLLVDVSGLVCVVSMGKAWEFEPRPFEAS